MGPVRGIGEIAKGEGAPARRRGATTVTPRTEPGSGGCCEGDLSPPLGTPLFRSIILLFGVLPIDLDDVTLETIEPGRGFRERSRTLSQREWIHERSCEPVEGGVRVTDRITFEPKISSAAVILAPLLHLVFRNRHRKLLGLFSGEVEGLRVV